MRDYQMGVVESRFADIIWEQEPISTTELVKQCEEILKWKKSTTYTVLKRLCDKGIFQNINGNVASKISRKDFYSRKSEMFVEESFQGSLPAFLAAFTAHKHLKPEDVAELRRMITEYEED